MYIFFLSKCKLNGVLFYFPRTLINSFVTRKKNLELMLQLPFIQMAVDSVLHALYLLDMNSIWLKTSNFTFKH